MAYHMSMGERVEVTGTKCDDEDASLPVASVTDHRVCVELVVCCSEFMSASALV